jgi:hypothetical protein
MSRRSMKVNIAVRRSVAAAPEPRPPDPGIGEAAASAAGTSVV